MATFVRYHSDEWSALYKDGELVVVGDSYLSDEYLATHLGVVEHYSDAYFLGAENKTYDSVAKRLEDVVAYEQEVSEKELATRKIDEQIRVLKAQAAELRGEHG